MKELSKDYRLYLVSNGSASVQKGRIESAGIAQYLKGIFISQQIGFDKPSTEFFTRCFSKIPDFEKRKTIIVGDSLSSDIRGGKNAGITTVWFNPGRAENASGIRPDYEIYKLLDLIPLLKTL